jgi:hypothetical protein
MFSSAYFTEGVHPINPIITKFLQDNCFVAATNKVGTFLLLQFQIPIPHGAIRKI